VARELRDDAVRTGVDRHRLPDLALAEIDAVELHPRHLCTLAPANDDLRDSRLERLPGLRDGWKLRNVLLAALVLGELVLAERSVQVAELLVAARRVEPHLRRELHSADL